jgi:hypothetical protein
MLLAARASAADADDGWRPATAQSANNSIGSVAVARRSSSRPGGRSRGGARALGSTAAAGAVRASCSLPQLRARSSGGGSSLGPGPPTRAMNRMIDHLVERKAVLTKMFVEYDADNSGTIDRDELSQALADLGLRMSKDEMDGVMQRLDSDGNGEIDLVEFMEHFKRERAKVSHIHPSIHPSVHPSIHPSIHPTLQPSMAT